MNRGLEACLPTRPCTLCSTPLRHLGLPSARHCSTSHGNVDGTQDDAEGEGAEGEGRKKRRKKRRRDRSLELDEEDFDLLEEQGVKVRCLSPQAS